MTYLNEVFRMPRDFEDAMPASNKVLRSHLNEVSRQINALAGGHLYAVYNASTAAPTGGTYAVGDYVRNSAPAEAGGAGSKYVILGWVCTVAGSPGTWLESRTLTGN
jgi:hypothetical protein